MRDLPALLPSGGGGAAHAEAEADTKVLPPVPSTHIGATDADGGASPGPASCEKQGALRSLLPISGRLLDVPAWQLPAAEGGQGWSFPSAASQSASG